jgi:hypothetical protein
MSHRLTRRDLFEVVAATAVGTVTVYAGARAQDAPAQKQSKAEAQYQDKPNNGQLCGICTYFIAPTSCQKVEGEIHPTGWCKNFQLKK